MTLLKCYFSSRHNFKKRYRSRNNTSTTFNNNQEENAKAGASERPKVRRYQY